MHGPGGNRETAATLMAIAVGAVPIVAIAIAERARRPDEGEPLIDVDDQGEDQGPVPGPPWRPTWLDWLSLAVIMAAILTALLAFTGGFAVGGF